MNAVDILNNEYDTIFKFLDENKQPSLSSDLNKYFKKVLILSAASFFEHQIQTTLVEFVSLISGDNPKLVSFLKKKAIGMQYHTYFTWGEKDEPDKPGKNANTFFSLFGDEFKIECDREVKANSNLDRSVKAFLELGHLRNILVHSNFAAMNFDTKTTADIFQLYQNGKEFVDYVKSKLMAAPNGGPVTMAEA